MTEPLRLLLVGDDPEARASAIQELRQEFPRLDVIQIVEGGGVTEALVRIGQLLAGLAHELNNPLSMIRGQVAALHQTLRGRPEAERIENISQAVERCIQLVQTFLALTQQQPGLQLQAAVRGKRILVVDDEPGIAAVLVEVLQLDGHTVETVSNGERALGKLAADGYDLILSDIRMPDMDGPSLYHEIARRHPHLLRRFIFLTGDIMSQEISHFLEETSVPFLRKPFTLEMVRDVVQRTLAEKHVPA
jgi:CheY-like chemotaxis protein